MSTEIVTIEDRHGYVLEIYDSLAECTIYIHKKDHKSGIKFNVDSVAAERILEAFRISRNIIK